MRVSIVLLKGKKESQLVCDGFLVRLHRAGFFFFSLLSTIKAACSVSLPAEAALYRLLLIEGGAFQFHSLILFIVQFLQMRNLASRPAWT